MAEILKPFFPGDFNLVRVGQPPRNFKRTPSAAELEYLLLRAEGFSPKQVEDKLGITKDASFSRRAGVVRRLGTSGVSQAIAVCFDRGILSMDETIVDLQQSLIGTNPYRLSGLEMAALRHRVLNLPQTDFVYKPSSFDNGAAKMRGKMGLEAESIPFAQALLYGYITTQEISTLALTEPVNPHFTDTHRVSLELKALGLKPAERAEKLSSGTRRAQNILPEINILLGTSSILESVLIAAKKGLINTSDLADRLTADKPYTVDTFVPLLEKREKQVLELIVKTQGIVSSKTELASKFNTTVGAVNSIFRDIKDKFGLGKIQAVVVCLESSVRETHKNRSEAAKKREREKKLIRQVTEQAERRRLLVQQIHNQHKSQS